MLLPIFYHLADVIALFSTVVGVTLHYMLGLIMAGVNAKWQDGTVTFFVLLMAEHINSIDPHTEFTNEDSKPDGSMPFLDMLITPTEEGRLNTTVYRKPTHTNMYLKWESHHPISSKYKVVGTLHHRAKTICSSPNMLQKEEEHLSRVLTKCKYPTWAINRVKMKMKKPAQKKNISNTNTQQNYQKPYMVVPYYQGLSESVKRTCNKHWVQLYFRGGVTIKNLLMAPKDQDPMLKKSGVIYRYKCDEWSVMRSTLESPPEHLERGSKNTRRPHPPSVTIITSLVIWLALITSAWWGERTRT